MRRYALVFFTGWLALAQQPVVVRVPMRDNVRLSTNVYLPPLPGKFPALLVRTPYGKGTALLSSYRVFLDRKFAVVVQDVRGRYASEGFFQPPVQEDHDGYDTLNWIARQSWSDGTAGMLGGSYLGIAQWRAALTANPHLRAIFPVVSGSDDYLDRFYSPGGAMKLGHRLQWIAENLALPKHTRPSFDKLVSHLPLRTSDQYATGQKVAFYQETLNHPAYDAYWKARSTRARLNEVRVPAFIVGGWYDNFVESDLSAFAELRKHSAAHRILVGPWPHNMSIPFPGISFGPDSGANIRRLQLRWFDHWMRGPQPVQDFDQPPVRIFVMGINKWRDEDEWPLARTRYTPFYLAAGKLLEPEPHKRGADEFTYDPRHPVPTRGGAVCCNPSVFPWGPMDQRGVEAREDVLVYSSAPLKKDMEVTGEVRAILHISTSAPDTDFTAKLVDVFPDGQARNICDGILRLRYRAGLQKPELAKPGEMYTITVPAGVTSNVFKSGHRIRLEVSSSNFPRFDRNPNTGRAIADEMELRVAHQTVYYGVRQSSHLLLPVIP
jgi:putative CocE/NonD family hydrolase